MKNRHTNSRSRSRNKPRSNTLLYTVGAAILLFVISFYFYTKEESVNAHSNNQPIKNASVSSTLSNTPGKDLSLNTHENSQSAIGIPVKSSSDSQQISEESTITDSGNQQIKETDLDIQHTINDRTTDLIEGNAGYSETSPDYSKQALLANTTNDFTVASSMGLGADPTQSTGLPSTQPDINSPINKEIIPDQKIERKEDILIRKLNSFYEHLDQQSYMKDFNLNTSSKIHFSRLLQRLTDAPPVVTNETNDLFTILKNTAHFFRIIGKENIIILKGILDREKASFEDVLKNFYALTDYPEALENQYGLTLSQDVLYDYAGFFLNTMGGRLYLFRRDSASRMTVSFYAIQIVDQAIREGNNRHGIDLLPAIDFLIDEMESTGKRLLLKEDYLDALYDLKEMYN